MRSGISEGACGDTETVEMDLEGIGIGADGMSGDSDDVAFVVALIIHQSRLQLESPQFLLVSKFSADVFPSNARLCFADLPTPMRLFLLDYGAGNVQSLANTLGQLGHSFNWITSPADFDDAAVSLFIFYHPVLI
jgi:hypothetical protein